MRSILIVLDSLGIGAAPDAGRYGDWGADTLGHIFAQSPDLTLPALFSMGMGQVLGGGGTRDGLRASHGRVRVASPGKDSMTGHWEAAGIILKEPFTVFDKIPARLLDAIQTDTGVEFIISTEPLNDQRSLWKEHAATGRPVLHLPHGESAIDLYALEQVIPRRRLYEIARIIRRHVNSHLIATVVAQPFTQKPALGAIAPGRHEYPLHPPRTVLNAISEAGILVQGIGKISSVFGRGCVTHAHAANTNTEALAAIDHSWDRIHDGLIFANLPDFDRHGHARNVPAYAKSLADFDHWLAAFLTRVHPDDLVILTADHGNDPAFKGNAHTREELPLLVHFDHLTANLGTRDSLADIAATLALFFKLRTPWPIGKSLIDFRKPAAKSAKAKK